MGTNALIAANSRLSVELASFKEVMSTTMSSAKGFTTWTGHKVVQIGGLVWEASKAGLLKLIEFLGIIWTRSLPHIFRVGAFLISKPGIFGIAFVATVLLHHMAINDENLTDPTGRRALQVMAMSTSIFLGVFGAQSGLIPQFI